MCQSLAQTDGHSAHSGPFQTRLGDDLQNFLVPAIIECPAEVGGLSADRPAAAETKICGLHRSSHL